jgi:hypothetical protein
VRGGALPADPSTATAREGDERKPSSLLATRRIVSYYGLPGTNPRGVLGALSRPDLVGALDQRKREYERVGRKPVQQAIEFVTTTAITDPGEDGLYRVRADPGLVQEYVDLTAARGFLFFADIQPGRSSVESEIEAIRAHLELPHVHLALDPEYRMSSTQIPGEEIGEMRADEISAVVRLLSEVAQRTGHQKVLVVHQFTPAMLPDRGAIEGSPWVDIVLVMDGIEPANRNAKVDSYRRLVRDRGLGFSGIKLYYTEEANALLSPGSAMELAPPPDLVIYQ